MDAIAGIIYPEDFPLTFAVNSALEVLATRCKGEAHTYGHKNVELGTRGTPITFNDRRTACLLIDGHIENRDHIVAQLRKLGHKVEHPSLAQLIYQAYEAWHGDFAAHLQGVFAIALYDLPNRKLILARDPIGVRPLYWTFLNQTFLFASELKALLATGLVPQNPCEEAISAYLQLGFIPQDLSPIRQVNKLLPAHTLSFDLRGNLTIQSYWSYSACFLRCPVPIEDVPSTLDKSLSASIQKRLPSSGSAGYLANSSVASATVGHYLSRAAGPENTLALTAQFSAEHIEETSLAGTVANSLGVQQRTFEIAPTHLLQNLIKTTWRLDEPIGEPLVLALWRTLSLSKELTHTIFTDVGANKILTGSLYNEYLQHGWPLQTTEARPTGLPWFKRFLMRALFSWLPSASFTLMRQAHTAPWLEHFAKRYELFSEKTLRTMSPTLANCFALNIFVHRFYQLHFLGEGPNAQLYLDAKTALSDRDLLVYDRLPATFGVETYSPFLELPLIEQLASAPEELKRPHNNQPGPLQQLLSPTFKDLQFTVPFPKQPRVLSSWLHDPSLGRTFEYLKTSALVESGWISARWIRQALSARHAPHLSFKQLWSLLTLEVWYRLYITNPIQPTPPDTPLIEFLRRG